MAEHSAFNCPHCGKLIFCYPTLKENAQPVAAPVAPVTASPAPARPAASARISPDDIPTRAVDITDIPLKDVILEPDPIEEAQPADAEPIESIEPEPIENFEEIEELKPEDLEDYKPKRPVRTSGSRPDSDDAPARPARRPMPQRPAKPAGAARRPDPTGEYALFLEPIRDRKLEGIAIDLIIEFANVSEKEASAMIRRPNIIVLRDVSKEEAEDALAAFEQEGLYGSIKRKAPRR